MRAHRLAVFERDLWRDQDIDRVGIALLLLGKRAAHFLLRQVHVVVRLGHGLDQLLALDLEPRLTNCLAPRPFDPAAEHLGDVGFVPSLDDIAGDVIALRIFGGDDVADLDLARLARVSLRTFLAGLRLVRVERQRCRVGRAWRLTRTLGEGGMAQAEGKTHDGSGPRKIHGTLPERTGGVWSGACGMAMRLISGQYMPGFYIC